MMLVKLIGIALIGVVAVSVLRTAKPEFAAFAVDKLAAKRRPRL